jgi:phosphoglycolate phosphatase
MKYQAIVFDWDGTLVDSTGRIVESMQLAAREAGMKGLNDFDVKQIIGLGLPEAICQLWPELSVGDDQVANMRVLYNKHYMNEARPAMGFFEHAEMLLGDLLKADLVLAVATGKSRSGLDRAFRGLKAGHLFRDSRCADETKSKPHPLMLEELLDSLGVEPDAMLMVGDTTFDLDMAKAAGVDSIGITHGAHTQDKLESSGPIHMVHNLKELNDWLLK